MDSRLLTGRVVHGGYAFFQEAAPRIEAAVPMGDRLIVTRGALHLPLPTPPYWFYNTEPLHVRGKLTLEYRALLDGAERVFEYSEPNLQLYPRAEFCEIQLGAVGIPPDLATCDIDILFYGYPTKRRRAVLTVLPATIVTAFGTERTHWIRRAKIVLCLNAYDTVNGNPFRVFPVLETGAHAVVEHSREKWINEVIEPHARVVHYAELVATCRRILSDLEPHGA